MDEIHSTKGVLGSMKSIFSIENDSDLTKGIISALIIAILATAAITSYLLVIFYNIRTSSLNEQIDDLEEDISNLQLDYEQLLQENDVLRTQYNNLQNNYSELELTFEQFLIEYDKLFNDYELLRNAFEEPLENPTTPTHEELVNWLSEDNTDEHGYTESVWECGDFAAMLMTRAKEMNWRMRIAIVFYSFEGDSGYGSESDVYGSGGHAFNIINCTNGIWYIEPQTDGIWDIKNSTGDRIEFTIHNFYNFEFKYPDSIWDGYWWWTNFYTKFA